MHFNEYIVRLTKTFGGIFLTQYICPVIKPQKIMKRYITILFLVAFSSLLFSCGTTVKATETNKSVAGYTLKSKKERFSQKILYIKNKTLVATP